MAFSNEFGFHNDDYSFTRKVSELVFNSICHCIVVTIGSVKDFKFEIWLKEELVVAKFLQSTIYIYIYISESIWHLKVAFFL